MASEGESRRRWGLTECGQEEEDVPAGCHVDGCVGDTSSNKMGCPLSALEIRDDAFGLASVGFYLCRGVDEDYVGVRSSLILECVKEITLYSHFGTHMDLHMRYLTAWKDRSLIRGGGRKPKGFQTVSMGSVNRHRKSLLGGESTLGRRPSSGTSESDPS